MGSDEAQEQGSSVSCWTHQASVNQLVPKGAYRAHALGMSTLGGRGG